MRALATRKTSRSAKQTDRAQKRRKRTSIQGASISSATAPILQRKPNCACGGNCPSCRRDSHLIQPKLKIGAPNDRFEQEADRVADQIMRMPDKQVLNPAVNPSAHSEQTQNVLSNQDLASGIEMNQQQENEGAGISEPDFGVVEVMQTPRPETASNDLAQTGGSKRTQEMCQDYAEEETLQRKTTNHDSGLGNSLRTDLENGASGLEGKGQPLPESVRATFEPRLGHDFSGVKIYTDTRSANLVKMIQAKAFTLGQNIAFGHGEYNPDYSAGRKLLAHELTHVVQQSSTSSRLQKKGPASEGGEKEAPNKTIREILQAPLVQRQLSEKSEDGEDPVSDPCKGVKFGKLEKGNYGKKSLSQSFNPKFIIFHRTAGSKKLEVIKAHFEIDSVGTIYLANPLDKPVRHLSSAGTDAKLDDEVVDANSIGIEIVGKPYSVQARPEDRYDKKGIRKMRNEISSAVNLPASFKARLKGMSDVKFYYAIKYSGWNIYPDINAEQKRAISCLEHILQMKFGPLEVKSHEEVDRKTIGEGESIKEFIVTEKISTIINYLKKKHSKYWQKDESESYKIEDSRSSIMITPLPPISILPDAFNDIYAIEAKANSTKQYVDSLVSRPTSDLFEEARSLTPIDMSTSTIADFEKFKNWALYNEVTHRMVLISITSIVLNEFSDEVYFELKGTNLKSPLLEFESKDITRQVLFPISKIFHVEHPWVIEVYEEDWGKGSFFDKDDKIDEFDWSIQTKSIMASGDRTKYLFEFNFPKTTEGE